MTLRLIFQLLPTMGGFSGNRFRIMLTGTLLWAQSWKSECGVTLESRTHDILSPALERRSLTCNRLWESTPEVLVTCFRAFPMSL